MVQRRRALLALALISHPLERHWREIFLDMAWLCWADAWKDGRRQRLYEQRSPHFRQQQLRRKAILALALISEPDAGCWEEVYLDAAFSAWTEVLPSRFEVDSAPVKSRSRVRAAFR